MSPHVPFPLADEALYLFAVTTHSHEHMGMLEQVSLLGESLNLGVV